MRGGQASTWRQSLSGLYRYFIIRLSTLLFLCFSSFLLSGRFGPASSGPGARFTLSALR